MNFLKKSEGAKSGCIGRMSKNESGEWVAPKMCKGDDGEDKSCRIVCNEKKEKTCEDLDSCEWLPKDMTKDEKVKLEAKLEKAKLTVVGMVKKLERATKEKDVIKMGHPSWHRNPEANDWPQKWDETLECDLTKTPQCKGEGVNGGNRKGAYRKMTVEERDKLHKNWNRHQKRAWARADDERYQTMRTVWNYPKKIEHNRRVMEILSNMLRESELTEEHRKMLSEQAAGGGRVSRRRRSVGRGARRVTRRRRSAGRGARRGRVSRRRRKSSRR